MVSSEVVAGLDRGVRLCYHYDINGMETVLWRRYWYAILMMTSWRD